jgi:Arc/MetJ family transcription regulator
VKGTGTPENSTITLYTQIDYYWCIRKEVPMSRTNIELNDKVLKEALKLTKMKTKKDLVNYALEELVKKLHRKKILELEGKVKWEGNLNEMRISRV